MTTSRFPTRAELLKSKSTKKTVEQDKIKRTEEQNKLIKRINTVKQRIAKTNEVLNRHEKRKRLLVSMLQEICNHVYLPHANICVKCDYLNN